MRLRWYLVLLVLATLVPLLAFSIFLVYEQQSAGRRAQERDLLQAARAAAASLDDSFATTVLDLRALASSIHLDTGDLRAFHEQARRVQGAYVDWTSVSLFDPSGQRLLYTPEPLGTVLPPRPGAMAERFRILVETREPGVSDLFLLPTAKRWGIAIAVPVIRERQVRYVLSAGVDGAALAGVLARQHAPRDWSLTLVDRRGVVAASSREPERQGQPAPANPAAGGAADGVARSTAADGTSTYVAYSRSPHFGWTAILTAPAAALQAGAIRPLWAVAAMGVVLALAGTVLAVGLGRGVDRSVRSIVAEADRLGRGETPRPVASPIRETRELSARLAAAGQERARAEEEIQGRARQQAALAEFGRRAFSGADVDALFADALRVVADTLGVESVVLLERLRDGTLLRMRAGLGVPEGMVGTLTVPASADTPAGQSLRSGEPVVIGDIREQAEYEVPARVSERGIVSTVTVPVAAGDAVWGVLGAYATRPRAFVRDEVSFLQTLASMLGAVVERATVDAERASYADRLAILHDVDRALIAERSPEAIAEAVLSRLRDLLRVPRAIVNVFDLEAGEVEWLAAVGRKRMHVGPGIRYPLALAGDTEALRRGEPQIVNVDTLPPSGEVTALLASGVQYYMVVPMVAAGELIGSVSFGGPSREFPAEQVDIAQEVATQLAIAIAQARLHEQVKRQAVELEQRVEARTRELAAVNKELEAFTYTVAHDLKSPLRGVTGFAHLLKEHAGGQLDDTGRRYVDMVQGSAVRMAQLIDDLLRYARIERNAIERQPVDLKALLDGVLLDLAVELESRELRVTEDLQVAQVLGERTGLREVLANLISNAVKFSPKAGEPIVVRSYQDGAEVVLAVADHGVGFDMKYADRIFGIFERLHRLEDYPGTGVGLAIVRKVAERHGGRAWARSEPGQGSTFFLAIPAA